jgi:hypothetical protein
MEGARRRTRHKRRRGGDPQGKENNQYDVEILTEAKKSKLFDVGARLRSLKPLASLQGKKAAKAAAVSDVAKKILADVGGRRRTRRRHTRRR